MSYGIYWKYHEFIRLIWTHQKWANLFIVWNPLVLIFGASASEKLNEAFYSNWIYWTVNTISAVNIPLSKLAHRTNKITDFKHVLLYQLITLIRNSYEHFKLLAIHGIWLNVINNKYLTCFSIFELPIRGFLCLALMSWNENDITGWNWKPF